MRVGVIRIFLIALWLTGPEVLSRRWHRRRASSEEWPSWNSVDSTEKLRRHFSETLSTEREDSRDTESPTDSSDEELEPEVEEWFSYKIRYGKAYETDEEELYRRSIYQNNTIAIRIHNDLHSRKLKSFRIGVNEYADLTQEEFSAIMNGHQPNTEESQQATHSDNYQTHPSSEIGDSSLPLTVDWRSKGFVTDIKNQGRCGSCWAFAATGATEGQLFNRTGRLVSLSEQNLVDCSSSNGNHGCRGGNACNAYKYIRDHGIDREADYPYTASQGSCRFHAHKSTAHFSKYILLRPGNEAVLQHAVSTKGPIAVAIDAGLRSFQLYKSGVYDDPECTNNVNHAVLVVGYGSANGTDYWLVKNSWGKSWGFKGYVYMIRNRNGLCGIATQSSYPYFDDKQDP